MTDYLEELGGRPTSLPITPKAKGNCGHDCRLNRWAHPDQHVCPWRGDEHLTDCGCTPQETP